MYVTRPLSLLRRCPELLSEAPHEGPNSGYMVLLDEECETTTCFGLCKDKSISGLPFPQNKDLTVCYFTGAGEHRPTYFDDVVFIPVLDQPLSSNRYYVISRQPKTKGKPRPLEPLHVYDEQVEIIQKKSHEFTAVSIGADGFPPLFLRRKYWRLYMKTPPDYQIGEAPGLNSSLRARLPELPRSSPSNSSHSETLLVGKWYCPLVFVKELGEKLEKKRENSMFYEMTLEQKWDKIFECENSSDNINVGTRSIVCVDMFVERENACVDGKEAVCDWVHVDHHGNFGVIWYRSSTTASLDVEEEEEEEGSRILGMSVLIMERMRWEQERVGFILDQNDDRKLVKVKRSEEFDGENNGGWRKFSCYVLVERFVLKRADDTVLLTHDFKHTNQIKCTWE